jgi:cell division protein FtsQ
MPRGRRRAPSFIRVRVSDFIRRFGLIIIGGGFVAGSVSYLFLSGIVTDYMAKGHSYVYDKSVEYGFVVNQILVEGRVNSDVDIIRAILNLERGDPLLAFNPYEAKELIERISWVKAAHIERRLPDTVYILLQERRPLALWQHKGKLRVIDSEGTTLTDALRQDFSDLPIIVGEDAARYAPTLLGNLEAEPSIYKMLDSAIWLSERRWDLKLKNGVIVKLPDQREADALKRLSAEHELNQLLDRAVTHIDLRDPQRIIVKTVPGAVEAFRDQQEQEKKQGGKQGRPI